jgi:CheY-like chemotaxis protein
MAADTDPDVIVMDYKMPGMDGLTAARAIREKRPSQAIILYTAYLDANLESEARAAGIALCIGKVEGLNQLERHITELVRDY